jgi:hypothetical protein
MIRGPYKEKHRAHYPIKSNDFFPRQPWDDEFEIIRETKCIHCKKKYGYDYEGGDIIFTILSTGELIYWHNYTCV